MKAQRTLTARPTPSGAQLTLLACAARTPQGNRGKTLELMLERTHQSYEQQLIGKVERLPNAWRFAHHADALRAAPALRAVTGLGRHLLRVKTPWDFHGHVGGRAVAFDAKEFAGASLPIHTNLKHHQALNLWQFARTGGVAGFMIYAVRTGQVWWLDAHRALELVEALRLRRPGALKSLNLAWFDCHALLVAEVNPYAIVDWAPALLGERNESVSRS